ncbi:MAG TPA: hypothetical protein P5137_12465, partial [Candidatus Brocadiia bacterium]|nr:hypothetical protein [Candidatus Brocadiia bacterium]
RQLLVIDRMIDVLRLHAFELHYHQRCILGVAVPKGHRVVVLEQALRPERFDLSVLFGLGPFEDVDEPAAEQGILRPRWRARGALAEPLG